MLIDNGYCVFSHYCPNIYFCDNLSSVILNFVLAIVELILILFLYIITATQYQCTPPTASSHMGLSHTWITHLNIV